MGNNAATGGHLEASDDHGGRGTSSPSSYSSTESKVADSEGPTAPSSGDFSSICCQDEGERHMGLAVSCLGGNKEGCRGMVLESIVVRTPSPREETSHTGISAKSAAAGDESQAPPSLSRGASGASTQTGQSAEAAELMQVQAKIQAVLNEQQNLVEDIVTHDRLSRLVPKDEDPKAGRKTMSSTCHLAAAPCRMAIPGPGGKIGWEEDVETVDYSSENSRGRLQRSLHGLSKSMSFHSKGKSTTSFFDLESEGEETTRFPAKGFPAVVSPRGRS